jgi:hypothetical protein
MKTIFLICLLSCALVAAPSVKVKKVYTVYASPMPDSSIYKDRASVWLRLSDDQKKRYLKADKYWRAMFRRWLKDNELFQGMTGQDTL